MSSAARKPSGPTTMLVVIPTKRPVEELNGFLDFLLNIRVHSRGSGGVKQDAQCEPKVGRGALRDSGTTVGGTPEVSITTPVRIHSRGISAGSHQVESRGHQASHALHYSVTSSHQRNRTLFNDHQQTHPNPIWPDILPSGQILAVWSVEVHRGRHRPMTPDK